MFFFTFFYFELFVNLFWKNLFLLHIVARVVQFGYERQLKICSAIAGVNIWSLCMVWLVEFTNENNAFSAKNINSFKKK